MLSSRTASLLAIAIFSLRLDAQCPDGRQPPCTRPVVAPHANTVAVLYFEARDTADAFLAEGLAEEIATSLGRVPRVSIKVPSSVRRAQQSHAGDVRAMARALGVRWVVDGSLRRSGNQLRVSVRLVDGERETVTWSNAFTRTTDDLLAIQEEVAREVAIGIVGVLTPVERAAVTARITVNPQAYERYLKGNWYSGRRGAWLVRAVDEYREAVAIDPAFQAARAGAALAYISAADAGDARRFGTSRDSLFARALVLADSVIQRDPSIAMAWAVRAAALRVAEHWSAARQAIERAVALDPNSAEMHFRHGQLLLQLMELPRARSELERSLALDASRPVIHEYLGIVAHMERKPNEALRHLDDALELDPQFELAHTWKAVVLYASGDTALANALVAERARLFAAQAQPGARAPASSIRDIRLYGLGAIQALALVGEHQEALGRLGRATFPGCRYIVMDPSFDPVRRDPRFVSYETECRSLPEPP